MAGFVRSDTDTTPLGIMMMAQRSLLLGMRMKMKLKGETEMIKRIFTQMMRQSYVGMGEGNISLQGLKDSKDVCSLRQILGELKWIMYMTWVVWAAWFLICARIAVVAWVVGDKSLFLGSSCNIEKSVDSPARLGDDHLSAVLVEFGPQVFVLQGHLKWKISKINKTYHPQVFVIQNQLELTKIKPYSPTSTKITCKENKIYLI